MTQKAPERIITSVCGKQIVQDGVKRLKTDVEWMPVDHTLALVAAAREACASGAENSFAPGTEEETTGEVIAAEIRARTDDDAQAALEARDARIRNKALREAAEVVYRSDLKHDAHDEILALITEDQSD